MEMTQPCGSLPIINPPNMLSRAAAVLALAGSAAAFNPMMALNVDRRSVLQTGAAAAVVTPLLRPEVSS